MSEVVFPEDFRYTKTHEWIKVTGKTGRVGLTHYAQDHLGEIVFVELPGVGQVLKQGDVFGVVESVKAVSDCYSPAAGKVTRVNDKVTDSPELVNQDPHGEGWLYEMELEGDGGVGNLMDAEAYDKFQAEAGTEH
ncbi:MAG: glycine cleavage system protein GcvH [Bacillota bacterium]|jgi:glycine cleavage system H protein|nr:MAG: glycine cleavage system protein GcvH [Bacillota bacterium]